MNKIKFKVKEYDEETHSIVVAYSSDETATNNPDDYTPYNVQILEANPDVTDIEVMKKKIAEQGIGIADDNKRSEDAAANTSMQTKLRELVGQTFEYNLSDLQETEVEVSYDNEAEVPDDSGE